MALPPQLGLLKDQLAREGRLDDDERQLLRELQALDELFSPPSPDAAWALQMTGPARSKCRCCGQTLRP